MTDTNFPDALLATLGIMRALAPGEATYGTKFLEEFADGDVPVLPYVRLDIDSTAMQWPVLATVGLRVMVWDVSDATGLARAWRLFGMLRRYGGGSEIRAFRGPSTGPIPASDPDTGRPLSSFTIAALLRPIPI